MPAPAAFFDLDLTLLRVNSATLWLKFMWRRGELRAWDAMRSAGWLLQYRMATLDITDISRKFLTGLAGQSEAEMRALVATWYAAEVREHLYEEARALVEEHRAKGHKLVLLTGSSPYISTPVTEELGLDAFLCTRLEVDPQGKFTGVPIEPLCYGHGKVHWARRWAERHDVDLDTSWFYSDSFTDLPMLEEVGHPVATNPDPRLRRHAVRTGMAILDFTR
jgi:HAD superfamily hydrolase (TIGR01490 family)